MEKIELTESEKIILEKRGFYVRKIFSGESLISMVGEVGMIFFIGLGIGAFITIFSSAIIITIVAQYFPILNTNNGLFFIWIGLSSIAQIILFIRFRINNKFTFFYENGVIQKTQKSIFNNSVHEYANNFYGRIYLFVNIIIGICTLGLLIFIVYLAIGWLLFYLIGLYFVLSIIGIIITFALHKIYGVFHPLYAFGSLGEKIQSLTPHIERESTKIREIFSHEETIDYKTLHHSFDTLSHTFEKIASLVIRLEKIESRANTGNLFDSQKYIGSLKNDILTPLSSLSTFLGEKEIELRAKQEELTKMRVQVGGSGESGQTTLTSVRMEPLIEEIGRQRGVISSMKEKISLL